MANLTNVNKSSKNLHNFLKEKSSKLEQIGQEKKHAEKETTLKKKRHREKKMLIDSVVNKQTEGIYRGESPNLHKKFSRESDISKKITLRETSNEEKNALADFLEKKSSMQKQIIQKTIRPETKTNNFHALKNQQPKESFEGTKGVQTEKREKQEEWIKSLIKNTMAEQRLWTKGVINSFKKEQAERENKQNEWIKNLIKSSSEKHKKLVKSLKKEKERGKAESEKTKKQKVIKNSQKEKFPKEKKDKIAKKSALLRKKKGNSKKNKR